MRKTDAHTHTTRTSMLAKERHDTCLRFLRLLVNYNVKIERGELPSQKTQRPSDKNGR